MEVATMLARERVVLLCLLETGRPVGKLALVKLLFLMRQETVLGRLLPFYDFVPYQYGPFSFVLYHELARLGVAGLVVEDKETVGLVSRGEAVEATQQLPGPVREAVAGIVRQHGGKDWQGLVDYVYGRYPWFAGRSKLRKLPHRPARAGLAVHTLGYEGRSLDAFLNLLMEKGIARIIDVRRNAYSMKYGFSAKVLSSALEKCGVKYVHIPELGIPSDRRADLSTEGDYARLFAYYESVLPQAEKALTTAGSLLNQGPSALLCFEADPGMCHRSRLARVLASRTGLEVVNL